MRFLIGFAVGMAIGFVVTAALGAEERPTAETHTFAHAGEPAP